MDNEEIIKAALAHIEHRVIELKKGGVFQQKGLTELYALKEILAQKPVTRADLAALRAPPEGSEHSPVHANEILERSKEIYDREVAAGRRPEHYQGESNPGGAKPRPCPKAAARAASPEAA